MVTLLEFANNLKELEMNVYFTKEADKSYSMNLLLKYLALTFSADFVSFYFVLENRYTIDNCYTFNSQDKKENITQLYLFSQLLEELYKGQPLGFTRDEIPFDSYFELNYWKNFNYNKYLFVPVEGKDEFSLAFFQLNFLNQNSTIETTIIEQIQKCAQRLANFFVHLKIVSLKEDSIKDQNILLNSSDIQTWVFLNPSQYGKVNEAHAKFFGYTKEEMDKKLVYSIHNEYVGNIFVADNLEVFKNNQKTIKETEIINSNGEEKILKITRTPIFLEYDEKNIAYILCNAQDVTDYKRIQQDLINAKDEAEASNCAKTAFLGNMSHEIRTPLNGIVGFTELMQMSDLNEEQKDYLVEIQKLSNHLVDILSDIFDLSIIESKRLKLDKQPFEFENFIKDAVRLTENSAISKGLKFTIDISKEIPKILIADKERLKQLLNYILSNAEKFTLNGEINVFIEMVEENSSDIVLKFNIIDTGIGIYSSEYEKIFLPFTQLEDYKTKVYSGIGLGLTLAKHLVKIMGGELKINSEFEKGSTFTFTVVLGKGELITKPTV